MEKLPPQPAESSNPPPKSIAVLPFVNMSGDPGEDYFCDGMTEEIINALAKIEGLRVTSRTSSFFFKGQNRPIPEIGAALNVSIILEGSIRLAGTQMRLTAQLIDVAEDYHFFSETFDRPIEDIFAVQDEISLLLADRLREHLGHLHIEDQLVEDHALPVAAYKQYLKARFLILRMRHRDIQEGIALLEEVIAQQSGFALAHLGVHLGYTMLGTIGLAPAETAFATGKKFLDQAIALAPELPECQLQLSYIAFLQDWDLPQAYAHLNKVYQIRPMPEFFQSMCSMLVAEGKFKAALHYIGMAMQVDPLSHINFHLKGFVHYCQKEYATARSHFERSIELNPGFVASTLYLGQTMILMERHEEAQTFFQAVEEEPGDVVVLGGTTLARAARGEGKSADAGRNALQQVLSTDLIERALQFLIYTDVLLGEIEAAMEWVEKAIAFRLPMMMYVFVDPLTEPLWALPRFQELRRELLGKETPPVPLRGKYKQELLAPSQIKVFRQKLLALMAEESPYLDPSLTLRHLAEQLNLPPNHLSQLLNEGMGENFSEFVNRHRLEAFKSQALDPRNRNLTLLALALDSGFNSKTTFNTYFKKRMGTTPRTWWKESLQQ